MINGETTLYVGQHYEVTGSVITKYYLAGAQRIAFRRDGVLNYLLSDHLGSASLTTDDSGNEIASMRYTAWGETRYSAGTLGTDYQFTGQRNVEDIGLYFYNARWYDSALGRFAQADSIIPAEYNPQSWDRFAYVGGNPINNNDPDGHCWPACTLITGAAIGGAVGAILYIANPANQGENFSLGELALAAGVGAVAGAALLTIPGAVAAGSISAGAGAVLTGAAAGMATNSTGYMVGNIISGNGFETVDFSIAAGTGAASGALGPVVGTTTTGATVLGATSGLAQYEATYYAHNKKYTLDDGALFSTILGGAGGYMSGASPSAQTLFDTPISNVHPLNSINGFNPNYGSSYTATHAAVALEKITRQNLPRIFTGGTISNLPY